MKALESAPLRDERLPAAGELLDVRQKLAALRKLESRRRRMAALALVALVTIGSAIFLGLLDYHLVLPVAVRAMALSLTMTAAGILAWRLRGRLRYDESRAAAAVEAAYPQYGQRLRTSLDYSLGSASVAPAAAELVQALWSDTSRRTHGADFTRVSSAKPPMLAAAACAALLLAVLVALVAVPESRLTVGRLFFLPLHYSTVTVSPITSPVKLGDDVSVEAFVSGRPLDAAHLLYRPAGSRGHWKKLAMLPQQAGSDETEPARSQRLRATIADCRRSFDVVVIGGPQEHRAQRVLVLEPLVLKRFAARIEPPAYIRRKPYAVKDDDFVVPEGATARLRFSFNRPPARADLLVRPLDADGPHSTSSPPRPQSVRGNVVEADLVDLRQSVHVRLAARAGQVAFDSAGYRIRVQPDRKPLVRFDRPPDPLEVVPTAEVRMAVHAADDYGVERVGVVCQVADGPPTILWEKSYGEPAESAYAEPALYLENEDLGMQDAVTFYAFAEDNYFGSPRRSTTELRFIDIRPFKRSYEVCSSSGDP